MRYIKTIDDITKDGRVTFGDGYEFVTEAEKSRCNSHAFDRPAWL